MSLVTERVSLTVNCVWNMGKNNLVCYAKNSKERFHGRRKKDKNPRQWWVKEKREFKQERQNNTLNRGRRSKCILNSCREYLRRLTMIRSENDLGKLLESKTLVAAAQKHAQRKNYTKFSIDKNMSVTSPICRLRGKKPVWFIGSSVMNMTWAEVKIGMSTSRKGLLKI